MEMEPQATSGFDVVAYSHAHSTASSSLLRADSWEAEDAAQRWAQDLYYMHERSEQEYDEQYREALSPLLLHAQHRQTPPLPAQNSGDAGFQKFLPVFQQHMPLQSSPLRANTFGMPRAGSVTKRAAPVEQAHAKRQRGDAQPLPDWLMDD